MNIGILIRDFKDLSNWELRIIKQILEAPNLNLGLLVKDARSDYHQNNKNRLKRLVNSRHILGKLILKLQVKLESKFYKVIPSVDQEDIINQLKLIPCIQLSPERKGFLDIFSEADAQEIKHYNLDILLRHEFNIIRGPVLNAARYGIWSFHHGDNSINRGGPAGFWEIVLKQETVGVTLQQLTPELDGGLVIDKAFYNRHWSFYKTNQLILEASVTLLLKNIKKLQQGDFKTKKSLVYYNPLYRSPNLLTTLRYLQSFYYNLSLKIYERLRFKLFGIREKCWTLFIGKGSFMNATLYRLQPVKLPKNEFWADPFIYNFKGETYIFFENYNYKTKKGVISCGRIEGNQLVDVEMALEKEYHLSYPFIYEEDGNIFMMPETSENKRLEIYKCEVFPNKWTLHTTAFEDERVADAFFYTDRTGIKWLFMNKQLDINMPADSELYIYKVNSPDLRDVEAHQQNPVIINSKTARNGGAIFAHDGKLYRPSQANINGVYGKGLNINEITQLSIEKYKEETILSIRPNFYKNLNSTHHLHQIKDLFVIDAAYQSK